MILPSLRTPKPTLQFFFQLVAITSIPLFALLIYDSQLADENSDTGIIAVQTTLSSFSVYAVWIAIIVWLYPLKAKKPSEIFLSIYLPITCLCGASYWKITGLLDPADAIFLLIFLISPALAFKTGNKITFHRTTISMKLNLIPEKSIPSILICILILAAIIGYAICGYAGEFDLSTSYIRRITARADFSESSLFFTYFYSNAVNGAAPFLGFLGGRKNKIYLFLALTFALFDFWLIGTKSTALYIIAMFALGVLCHHKKTKELPFYFITALLLLFFISIAEYIIHSRSIIADYVIRRTFLVATQIQHYYFDAILGTASTPEILMSGLVNTDAKTPAFFIGNNYFQNPETNANTNAFFYALALGGIPQLLFCVMFVFLIFRFFDAIQKNDKSDHIIMVAALYTVLLLEQSFTVALTSSGVLLCLFLIFISSVPQKKNTKIVSRSYLYAGS